MSEFNPTKEAITRLRDRLGRAEIGGDQTDRDVRLLLDEVERLRWRKITPEDLPKVGDELYGKQGRMMILSEGYAPMIPMMEDFTYAGWTHFRSHVAPPQTKEG